MTYLRITGREGALVLAPERFFERQNSAQLFSFRNRLEQAGYRRMSEKSFTKEA